MWFVFALAATAGWGFADLFYKKGTDETDKYSHLRIAVWVGLVMGVCAVCLLPLAESGTAVLSIGNLIRYSPASLSYIISMVIGYAGLRYLELSIISPVQNASGALSAVVMIVFFTVTGRYTDIAEEFDILSIIGTAAICIGVVALAIAENRAERPSDPNLRRYRYGAGALIFPLLYCIFDTIGTAADGIILDEQTGLGLGEIDIIILYGLTFFAVGAVAWLFLLFREKKPYNPFRDKYKGIAAGFEEAGQVLYVYAMAANPVLSAPLIASYCILSVILSRVFLKEKLSRQLTAAVITVIAGIVLLGVSEGLSA